jgi:ABC-2 type transport system permease protein
MNRMTRLVARREISERLQGRLIWVLTAMTSALVVAMIVIPALVRSPAQPTVVGLVGSAAQDLGPTLHRYAAVAKVGIRTVDLPTEEAGRSEVTSGSADVAFTVGVAGAVAEVKESLSPTIGGLLEATTNEAHQRQVLGDAGVPPGTIVHALTPVPFRTTALEPPPPNMAARSAAAFAAGLLLYLVLGIYGAAVANGVAQEKTSRTAEVLLGALRSNELLTGKVSGIGVLGLAQMTVTVVAGLIANAVVQRAVIPSTVWGLLPAVLVWFLLGYALYSYALAAAGATVARQEEVQFATMPISILLVVAFLLVYAAIGTQDAWWIAVLSFVPPLAPVLMPARLALGHVPPWQIVLNIVIMFGAIYVTAKTAARIYSNTLVRGGARIRWGDALRLRPE